MNKPLLIISFLIAAIASAIGATLAFSQHDKLTSFKPTNATVLSSNVRITRGSKGSTHYHADITYQYAVAGRPYASNKIALFDETGGRNWAYALVNSHPPGAPITAYVNPADPNDAFLIHEHAVTPYAISTVGVLIAVVLFAFAFSTGRNKPAPRPLDTNDGWFLLQPRTTTRQRARRAWVAVAALLFLCAPTLAHFFAVAETPYAAGAWILSALSLVALLIALFLAARWSLASRRVAETLLFLDRPSISPAVPATARVEIYVLPNTPISQVRASLICSTTSKTKSGGKTQITTKDTFTTNIDLPTPPESADDPPLILPGDILLSDDAFPTTLLRDNPTPPAKDHYPRFSWRIQLHIKIPRAPDVKLVFPVEVAPAHLA
jgi:hypothetical protein